MPRSAVALVSLLTLAACLGPSVPNDHLVQACQQEPENWRSEVVVTNAILLADWVDLLEPQLRWTNVITFQPGYNPCAACAAALLRGFSYVEHLPEGAVNADFVWRYSFADAGDARCEFNEDTMEHQPPEGKCLAVERDVPTTAHYAIQVHGGDRNAHGIMRLTYQLIDMRSREVIAQSTELTQTGFETRSYRCDDVQQGRGDPREFINQSVAAS